MDILIAGNLIMDHYKEIVAYPEHSNLTKILSLRESPGGAVYSSGVDLAKLNPELKIAAVAVVGQDADGDKIIELMDRYPNMDTSNIRRSGVTSFTDVLEDVSNHTRTFFQYSGANGELSNADFDFDKLHAKFFHLGYLLLLESLDDEDADYVTRAARLLHDAQRAGMKTSIDIVSDNSDRYVSVVKPALKYCNYCIINEMEASRIAEIVVRNERGELSLAAVKAVCRALMDFGVEDWVVIHAREGGFGLDRQGNFYHKNPLKLNSESIKSTTGAGDAFLAACLYGAWAGYSLDKSISLAVATAAASLLCNDSTSGVGSEEEMWDFYNRNIKEDWVLY